ncbi:MAG: segregation/condensation protein A [Ruminococcus sp.]|nr:segregation/condensation protein A [Ruminococcus sp.]
MTSAQFKLDMFEGPLDLLLHLISKHKLNIYDIEIAKLLEQYLEYMNTLEHEDYEDAADFLEMAARLIYIKTVSLLPHDEEAQELKKELEGRIIEYSLCKLAAANLAERYAGGEIFVREPLKLPINRTFTGERDPGELLRAYLGMSERARAEKPLRAEMFRPIVSSKIVSVTSKIIHILKKLYTSGSFGMEHLYDGMTGKSERVAAFLAVLELTKSGRIFLNDDNTVIYMNRDPQKLRKRSRVSAFDLNDVPQEEEPVYEERQADADDDGADDVTVEAAAEETDAAEEIAQDIAEDTAETAVPEERAQERAEVPVLAAVEAETESVWDGYEGFGSRREIDMQPEVIYSEPEGAQVKESAAGNAAAKESRGKTSYMTEQKKSLIFSMYERSVRIVEKLKSKLSGKTEDQEEVRETSEKAYSVSADEEEPKDLFKPNYYGTRYYWGTAAADERTRNGCWGTGRLRIR